MSLDLEMGKLLLDFYIYILLCQGSLEVNFSCVLMLYFSFYQVMLSFTYYMIEMLHFSVGLEEVTFSEVEKSLGGKKKRRRQSS